QRNTPCISKKRHPRPQKNVIPAQAGNHVFLQHCAVIDDAPCIPITALAAAPAFWHTALTALFQ
ncbi:hypothetical protein, partial [Oceanimonas baumannii]|uniref:hypothetical protein n=1 Tax=Oceanimonas baumannii TaxID=129578 RepID=UPI003A8CEF27